MEEMCQIEDEGQEFEAGRLGKTLSTVHQRCKMRSGVGKSGQNKEGGTDARPLEQQNGLALAADCRARERVLSKMALIEI